MPEGRSCATRLLPGGVRATALLMLLAAPALLGCQKGSTVSGRVVYDGEPVTGGTITFLAAEDAPAELRFQAPIVNGAFHVASDQGLPQGSYMVAIRAKRVVGQAPADEGGTETVDRYEQFIPSQYNSRTTLTADVAADVVADLEFNLQPTPRKRRR